MNSAGLSWMIMLASALALTACGSSSGDGVGGVTASEASALNDAAAMLDERADHARDDAPGLNPAATAAARANREPGNAARP